MGSRRCWRNWGSISGILKGRYVTIISKKKKGSSNVCFGSYGSMELCGHFFLGTVGSI